MYAPHHLSDGADLRSYLLLRPTPLGVLPILSVGQQETC